MSDALVTINRANVHLEEETIYRPYYGETQTTCWIASLTGFLSTGESVSMQRRGRTAGQAQIDLVDAAAEQGWTIE